MKRHVRRQVLRREIEIEEEPLELDPLEGIPHQLEAAARSLAEEGE